MIIDGVDFVIGQYYIVEGHRARLRSLCEEDSGKYKTIYAYFCCDNNEFGAELYWGRGEYYTKEGWHGEYVGGDIDVDGHVIVNADPILAAADEMRKETK